MLAVKLVSRIPNTLEMNKYLGKEIPVENILEGFEGTVVVRVDDENAKFNLNSLNTGNSQGHKPAYESFKRLLKNLGIQDETIADRVAAWIAVNPMQKNGGDGIKNGFMDSVDELLLIKGIDAQTYAKLLPYVTVYGAVSDSGVGGPDTDLININTAPLPVIMSLADNISTQAAGAVIHQREAEPFTADGKGRIETYSGFGGNGIPSRIVVKPSNLHITVTAEENRIKRVVECVVTTAGKILYWKEI
jgi:type II secretory pathway component PulK